MAIAVVRCCCSLFVAADVACLFVCLLLFVVWLFGVVGVVC